MPTYPFLSPEWIEAARKIYEDATSEQTEVDSNSPAITMNLSINGVPFGEGTLQAHVDSTDGIFRIDLGSLDHAEVKLTLDYKIARSILLEGDAQVGMRAFLSGKIRVEGNMAKLLALQNSSNSPADDRALSALRLMTSTSD